ncbi:phenylalanine--tRNA ligase subunit beta [bacterium]|nr:phenylalanine--tRNA ligase subunit beta [bacterium]
MKFPLKWLLELCPYDATPDKIADLLTFSGSEVEDIQNFSSRISDVLVGQIKNIEENTPLPGMSKCSVDYGSEIPAVVLSRAPGIRIGAKYPFAPLGARLFDGKTIGIVEFEGVKSEGMLCSGVEIGLGNPKDNLLELHESSPIGGDILALLGWDDHIFELEITPNRPDCYGLLSLARELSALTGQPIIDKRNLPPQTGEEASNFIKIILEDSFGCPRYGARIVENIKIGPSPLSMMGRLFSCGIRPINNVVDATNYVMMFLSQPLHAFDLDRLESDTIIVRSARDGEVFTTLDGGKRTLNKNNLMIATQDRAVAIAGVMGGFDSEVTPNTKRILIESAYFNPRRIRISSRKLALVSESSTRFERGVDPNGIARAADECAAIISETAGGSVRRGIVDEYPEPIEPLQIKLSPKKVKSVIGVDIPEKSYTPQLNALGFEKIAKGWIIPTYRPDVTREIDLVEEVGRLYGYDTLEATLAGAGPIPAHKSPENITSNKIGAMLRGMGFDEIMSDSMGRESDYKSFLTSEIVKLRNPISNDFAVMRPMLIPGLLRIAGYNINRESDSIHIYEIDKVYYKNKNEFAEQNKIAFLIGGVVAPEDWSGISRNVDFFDLKGVVEQLLEYFDVDYSIGEKPVSGLDEGKSFVVSFEGGKAGFAGMVAPKIASKWDIEMPIFAAELPLAAFIFARDRIKQYRGIPRFPSTRRDVALIVDKSVPAGEILKFARDNFPTKLEKAFIFDIYEDTSIGKEKKSVGVATIFRDLDETITDTVANELHQALVNGLVERFCATIRN